MACIACVIAFCAEERDFSLGSEALCQRSRYRGIEGHSGLSCECNVGFESFCSTKSVADTTCRALKRDLSMSVAHGRKGVLTYRSTLVIPNLCRCIQIKASLLLCFEPHIHIIRLSERTPVPFKSCFDCIEKIGLLKQMSQPSRSLKYRAQRFRLVVDKVRVN